MVKLFGSVHDYVHWGNAVPREWADYCHVTFRITSVVLIYVRLIVQVRKVGERRAGGVSIRILIEGRPLRRFLLVTRTVKAVGPERFDF
jgi:hypothetical protein